VRRLVLLASAIALLALAPSAGAQAPLALTPQRAETGWVGVRVQGPPGARVVLGEQVGAAIQPLTTVTLGADGTISVARLAAWRCDRTSRTLAATLEGAAAAPVSAGVTTPSCAHRFAVTLSPARPRAARPLTVRIDDRWRVGDVALRVCLRSGAAPSGCRDAALRPGATHATARLNPVRPGRATVSVDTPWTRAQRRTVRVRPRRGRLRVLATGDSMIQILDGFLKQRLPRASVRSEAHISSGLTKPWMLNWPARARGQARALRPDATVVFIGANDGFALPRPSGGGDVPCCGAPWVDAYAARAASMMRAYVRAGAGRVYWLTLPTPRSRAFARVFRGVNAALRKAAQRFRGEVRLVDTHRVFTPGGRFRRTIRWHGRRIDARQNDGVHLSTDGAGVAASVVIAAMRRDGLI
jgi:hypothetical protein